MGSSWVFSEAGPGFAPNDKVLCRLISLANGRLGECLRSRFAKANVTLQSTLRNRLLSRMSADAFALLADHLQPVAFSRGYVFAEADTSIPFAHFLEDGLASIVAMSPEGQQAEAGIIGREGFVHPALVLGSDRGPHAIIGQLPGHSHRIGRAALMNAIEHSPELRRLLLLFTQTFLAQTSFTVLSNAVHQVDERLARWLLMCHDRSDSNDIPLTHEFMGIMLAVRRVSVTNALHALEGYGFIELARSYVVIRNRATLEEFAGDAYGKAEAEYRRLLGPL